MDDAAKKWVEEKIKALVKDAVSQKRNKEKVEKDEAKVHFIPYQYRIFGGLMHSLNIKFGNFIEKLIAYAVTHDPNLTLCELSGKKLNTSISKATNDRINEYMTHRSQNPDAKTLPQDFKNLLEDIVHFESQQISSADRVTVKKDVDVLFQKANNQYVYLEVKYNDDHDTGKSPDINRKLLITYAAIVKNYEIKNINEINPILYYFNAFKSNVYLPRSNIYVGKELFEGSPPTRGFFGIFSYDDLSKLLKDISNDPDIVAKLSQYTKGLGVVSPNGVTETKQDG